VAGSPLPWTGDYLDGLGNRLSMIAYANPQDLDDERRRGDGFGLVRFAKHSGQVTFECYPRFSAGEQYPGWPITGQADDNDGRSPVAWLPELVVSGAERPVVQVVTAAGEVLYTVRARSARFQPPVFAEGAYTVKVGRDRPDVVTLDAVRAAPTREAAGSRAVQL
jgi:hypothetical protein